MKIAINTRFLLKNRMEGFGRFTYEIAKELVLQNPQDEFIFLFDRPYGSEFIFSDNIKPVVLFPPARHPLLWYLWFEWSTYRSLKKLKPDIYFSPDGYLSLQSKVKTLMVCHDISFIYYPDQVPYLVNKYYKYYTPKFLHRADRLITLSNHARQDISSYYNIPIEKIDLTHAGSHGDFKSIDKTEKQAIRKKYSDGAPYFLYIGSIHPRKNIPRLLKAFELFKKNNTSNTKLLLAGNFGYKPEVVKSIYQQSAFKNDIIFLGYLDKDLYAVTAAAFVITYVSLYEGFGMPIVEAMNCEVPVITSNVSSMPEVVGDAGLTVDPNSVEAISQAMTILVKDEARYQGFKTACKEQAKKYTWKKAASNIYDSLLATLDQP